MEVIKRNGTKQQFDANKIINAIKGAYEDLDKPFDDEAERRAQDIAAYVEKLNREVTIQIEIILILDARTDSSFKIKFRYEIKK